MYVRVPSYKLWIYGVDATSCPLKTRSGEELLTAAETHGRWLLLFYCVGRFAPPAPASVPNFLFLILNIPPPSAPPWPKKSTFCLLFSFSNFGASKFLTWGLWISLNSFFFPLSSILNLSGEGWKDLVPVRPDKCVGSAARTWEYWEVGNEPDIGEDNECCNCLRFFEIDVMRSKEFLSDFGGGRRLWGGGGAGG